MIGRGSAPPCGSSAPYRWISGSRCSGSRHDLMGRFRAVADDSDLVLVAGRRQPAITTPSVGMDHRPGRHGILDEGKKAVRGHVLNAPKADPADAATPLLGRHRDDGLCFGFPAPLSLFGAADIGFVNLDSAGEAIPTGPDHRSPQLVEPGPRRLVAAEPEHPLQTQGADAVLLTGDEPHRQEPHAQRLARPLEHGARRQGRLPLASPTVQQSPRRHPRLSSPSAVWASKPVRPTQPMDIVPASTTHPSPETSADNQPRRRGVRCHRAQNLSRCTSHQAIIPANWSEGDTQ